jgi:uncharacterized protein (TIGR02285 family)
MMRHKTWSAHFLAAVFALAIPLAGSVADTVTWVSFDLPPVYILDGALSGQGVGDRQQLFLQRNLPDFDHRVRQADISRLWYDIKNSATLCATGVFRDEDRENAALFSARAILVPNYRIVALQSRKADFERFLDGNGALDLDRFAQVDSLKGAYVGARIHGRTIDRFFRQPARKITLDAVTKGQLLYNVLISKRVDFVFAVPSEIIYYRSLSGAREELVSFPIAGQRQYLKMYTACSRSALGERVISEVDAALANDQRWDEFVAPLKRWVDEADFTMALTHK